MADLCCEVFKHPSPNEYLAEQSEGDRAMFYVLSLVTQVDNGGIYEYLCGPYGDDLALCIDYLRKISATSVAESLRSLLSALPEGYYGQDRDRTERALITFCRNNNVENLEELFSVDVYQIDMDRLFEFCKINQRK